MAGKKAVDLDTVLYVAGNRGRYQKFQAVVLLLSAFSCSFPVLSIVFIGYVPEHQCAVLLNTTDYDEYQIDRENIVNIYYHQCSIDVITNTSGVIFLTQLPCLNGFYYNSHKSISIVSEWDLVCDRNGLAELSQTLLMLGQGIGAVIFTSLSDKLGRKPVNLVCHFLLISASTGLVFINNVEGFTALRMIIGASQQGVGLTAYAIFVELFTPDMRSYAGCIGGLSWTSSVMMLAPIGYVMRLYSWRYFQAVTVGAMSYAVALYWIMDESLRWLVANKKMHPSEIIIKKICRVNGTDFSKSISALNEQMHLSTGVADEAHLLLKNKSGEYITEVYPYDNTTSEKVSNVKATDLNGSLADVSGQSLTIHTDNAADDDAEKYTVLDIFKHCDILKTTAFISVVWAVNSLTYFGLFLTSSSMSGNRFLNFFLNALVEFPAMFAVFFALKRMGRKTISVILHAMSGLALIISVTLLATIGDSSDGSTASTVFSLFGKFTITASFNCLFIFTPELFPTNMRNAGIGLASSVARVGGMVAPYSSLLSQVVPWGPGIVFGIGCILACFLLLMIPETSGRALPSTITEMRGWKNEKVKESKVELKMK